jgi:hypothetical protein
MSECQNCGASIRSGKWCQRKECLAAKSKAWYRAKVAAKKPNDCEKCGKPMAHRDARFRVHIECRTDADRARGGCLGCGALIRIDTGALCCNRCKGLARKISAMLKGLDKDSND